MKANPALAAVALSLLAACTTADPGDPGASGTGAPASGTAPASSSAPPVSPSAAPSDPILAGRRQVVIAPIPSFESILAVDATGRLTLTDGDTDTSLFVLIPDAGGTHRIRTAKGSPPSCMGLRNNGANPLTVVAAVCDPAAKGQLFTVAPRPAKDSAGRPTYTIAGDGGVYLRTGRDGLIAEELGDAGPQTTFAFVDNGPTG